MKKNEIKGLNSFKPKKTLNPKFFNEKKKLLSDVRKAIIDVATLFTQGLEVPRLNVKDIIFTGSLANYNWSKYSDVDIHIIVDFSKLKVNKDLLSDYFSLKKEEWANNHEELSIHDFPVEMYVQDIKEVHIASGQYSVMFNEWLVEPEEFDSEKTTFDEKYVEDTAYQYIKDVLDIEKKVNKVNDRRELRKLLTQLLRTFKDLKNKRSKGILKNGEFDKDNIVYKIIRRNGYLSKKFDLENSILDKIYSL